MHREGAQKLQVNLGQGHLLLKLGIPLNVETFSVRTDLWLTLEEPDSTEELLGAVIDLAGLQVLHVLGPRLPLRQGRKVHRTLATMHRGTGHLCQKCARSRRSTVILESNWDCGNNLDVM